MHLFFFRVWDFGMQQRRLLLIKTALGDAIRNEDEVEFLCEQRARLRVPVPCTPVEVPRSVLSPLVFSESDFPDPKKIETEISNVCGFVMGYSSLFREHPAWRSVRSTLGYFKEAYSLRAGNLLFLRGKLIFKGATCRNGVYSTVTRLISEPSDPVLKAYLIIATAHMQRNVFVHIGCLLEETLRRIPWCRVMYRHEEMSNAVVFYINSWSEFVVPVNRPPPDMGTVTVSRRGVVNVRLGWHDGVQWENNDEWIALVNGIRDFVFKLC
jgi:hypothetical protein